MTIDDLEQLIAWYNGISNEPPITKRRFKAKRPCYRMTFKRHYICGHSVPYECIFDSQAKCYEYLANVRLDMDKIGGWIEDVRIETA